MIDRQDNYTPQIIKKSNLLIEKSNSLSFNLHKILNLVLLEEQQREGTDLKLSLPVRKFVDLVGEKQIYRTKLFYHKIAKKLISNTLDLIEPNELSIDVTSLISRFTLEKGFIHIKMTEEFKALSNLDYVFSNGEKVINYGYTKLDLNIVNKLNSKHSIALYEYLIMKFKCNTNYKKNKDSINLELSLDLLKKLLCNDKNSYQDVDLFNRKILKIAINEINNKTDIQILFKPIKDYNNKTIKGFNFDINLKEEKQINPLENNVIQNVVEPIKAMYKAIVPVHHLSCENLPESIAQAQNWGYGNIKELLSMYNGTEYKKYQILAILTQISMEYSEKSNQEKCKILSALIKKNAHVNALVIHNAKNKEIIQKKEQQNLEIMNTKNELDKQAQRKKIRENAYNEFQQELSKQESMVAKIWHKLDALLDSELPNEQQKNTWFKPAIATLENNILHIILPNRFKLDYFRNSLLRYVEKTLFNLGLNFDIKVGL